MSMLPWVLPIVCITILVLVGVGAQSPRISVTAATVALPNKAIETSTLVAPLVPQPPSVCCSIPSVHDAPISLLPSFWRRKEESGKCWTECW